MNTDLVYLKTNVVPEPLFAKWYAWPHLISPATAAANIVGRHLKIITSYIMAPQIHAAAVKLPQMLGGPFMDYESNRVEDIRGLKNETLATQSKMIELAEALNKLNKLLKAEAKGYSLEPLYEKVPEVLKGYVELVYDVNNQPSFRIFESLPYNSEFYDTSFQSISLYLIDNDDRPFVLSTPRLDEDHVLNLGIPFNSPALDELFAMQRTPQSYAYIKNRLNIPESQEPLFRSFFTTEAPVVHKKYESGGIRTTYFGHACILVETNEVSILSDPVISYGYNSDISRYTYTDLPDVIDYVVITHNHQDHILLETLLQIRHKVRNVIVPRNGASGLQDPSVKLMMKALGFENVIELDEMETIKLPGCTITGLPFLGEHSDLDIRTKLCHLVKLEQFSVLFAADSCNIEPKLYEHIHRAVGNVDILFLGMECDGAPLSWLYGPLLPEPLPKEKDHSRRLAGSNYARGLDLVKRFNPKEVFVYAMGQEPWLNYIMSLKYTEDSNPIVASNKLIGYCAENGINAERLFGQKEIIYQHEGAFQPELA
ncbi:MAG: MBL fold metallo-hydrolase [Cytophagales bacterium]|nr:MBL fold metallo-hydrolase [Cytophagales bacterium]